MRTHQGIQRTLRGFLAGTVVLVGSTACGYAKRDDVQAQLEQIRTAMQEGDEAVARDAADGDARLEARITALETELQALAEEFDATLERLEGAIAFNAPVHFDYDSAEMREADRVILDRFAAVVNEVYPGALITVEGFTDPAGSAEYNERLGAARAETVARYLTMEGAITSDRLRTVSYGEASDRLVVPDAQGPGTDGLENRRVALVIDFQPIMVGEEDLVSDR